MDFMRISMEHIMKSAKPKIYVASKVWHAPKILKARDVWGFNINGRWMEMGKDHPIVLNDKPRLWEICLKDVYDCDFFVIYSEPADEQRGALVELGMAYGFDKPCFGIGVGRSTKADHVSDAAFTHYKNFKWVETHDLKLGLEYAEVYYYEEKKIAVHS